MIFLIVRKVFAYNIEIKYLFCNVYTIAMLRVLLDLWDTIRKAFACHIPYPTRQYIQICFCTRLMRVQRGHSTSVYFCLEIVQICIAFEVRSWNKHLQKKINELNFIQDTHLPFKFISRRNMEMLDNTFSWYIRCSSRRRSCFNSSSVLFFRCSSRNRLWRCCVWYYRICKTIFNIACLNCSFYYDRS